MLHFSKKTKLSPIQYLCLVPLALAFIFLLLSNFLNYGSESTYLTGLIRLLNGAPFISHFNQTPLALSTYFPTAYLLFYPLGKLFGLTEPQSIALYARSLTLALVVFYLWVGKKVYQSLLPQKWSTVFLITGLLIFFSKEFVAIFSIKPDIHGIFLELIAIGLAIGYLQKPRKKWLLAAGVLFGLAIVIKLNIVAFLLAFFLTLVFSKKIADGIWLFLVTTATVCLGMAAIYLHLGSELLRCLLEATNSNMISLSRLPDIVSLINFRVILPYLPFLFICGVSLKQSKLWNPSQRLLIVLAFTLSFVLASVGQLKRGAYINYFHNFELLAILLSAYAINTPYFEPFRKTTGYYLSILLVAFSLRLLLFPAQVWVNDLKNYDFKKATTFLDKHFANPNVYTEFNNAGVHLASRSVLAAGFYNYYEPTDSIKQRRQQFIDLIDREMPINAIMVLGKQCQNPLTKKDFSDLLRGLNQLIYQQGKICIFGKGQKQ